jgi:hypothetical protein
LKKPSNFSTLAHFPKRPVSARRQFIKPPKQPVNIFFQKFLSRSAETQIRAPKKAERHKHLPPKAAATLPKPESPHNASAKTEQTKNIRPKQNRNPHPRENPQGENHRHHFRKHQQQHQSDTASSLQDNLYTPTPNARQHKNAKNIAFYAR